MNELHKYDSCVLHRSIWMREDGSDGKSNAFVFLTSLFIGFANALMEL